MGVIRSRITSTTSSWSGRAGPPGTHGALGQPTVGQSVTKVQVLNGAALYATSGHKGLGQQLCAVVDSKQPEFKNQRYDANIVKLQEASRNSRSTAACRAAAASRSG